MRAPTLGIQTFRRLALAPVAAYTLLVVTGGAVRLTGSGLGCPDWPACYQHRVTAALAFHPMIEFANRMVTVAVSVVSIVVFLAAFALAPKRRDLRLLGSGLLVGLAAQIVLGGLVVLFDLNPYLVALHFALTLVVLADAVLLHHRAATQDQPRSLRVVPPVLWLARLQLATLGVLIVVGTLVSGAGPHAGAPGTKRVDVAFRDIAELHSTIALFLIGMTLASLFALHVAGAPGRVQQRARTMLEVYAIQGVLGFTQYFLHDSAVVVELHLIGATSAFVATLRYYLELFEPVPLPVLRAATAGGPEPAGVLQGTEAAPA